MSALSEGMIMAQMTQRERMIGFLKGEPIDRLPLCQYNDMNAPNTEIWDALGTDAMGVLRWHPSWTYELNECRMEIEPVTVEGNPGHRTTIHTPVGSITEVRHELPFLTWDAVASEYYIKRIEDYEVLLAFLDDMTVKPYPEKINEIVEELGEQGLPQVSMPRTPYQSLWIEWVKMDDFGLHLADEPELLDRVMCRLGEHFITCVHATVEARKDAEFYHVTIGDNVHAPLIGPKMFEKWCMPYYNQASEILQAAGIVMFCHLDGDLQSIAHVVDQCTFHGFDSFAPTPDNDTTVAEAVARWTDKFIWANFPSSVHLESEDVIYRTARQMLDDAREYGDPKKFWIQFSENLPPGMWKKSIPAVNRALIEHGCP